MLGFGLIEAVLQRFGGVARGFIYSHVIVAQVYNAVKRN